jgi:hypothetical protein
VGSRADLEYFILFLVIFCALCRLEKYFHEVPQGSSNYVVYLVKQGTLKDPLLSLSEPYCSSETIVEKYT